MPNIVTVLLLRAALVAGVIGCALALGNLGGVFLLAVVSLLAARAAHRWPGAGDTYGRAAFATAAEVRAAGMTEPACGLHLGRLIASQPPRMAEALADVLTAPLSRAAATVENLRAALAGPEPVALWLTRFQNVSIYGATGSGKGAGIIVPTLLTYPGPVLVFDPKGENYRLALAARRAMGRHAFCIDPYRVVLADGGDCFNPMGWINPDSQFLPDAAKDLAVALVPRPGQGQEREPFFANMSELILQSFISGCVWGMPEEDRHLAQVADLIANPKTYETSLEALQLADTAYDGVLRTLGFQAARLEGREKASVLSSVAQYLGWLNSQPVRNTIRKNTFDPLWLRTHPADLFVILPPEKLRSASGFSRYLLTGILRRLAQGTPDERNPVFVILDEVATLGPLPVLEDAVCLLRGWALKFAFIWQAVGQVADSFPGNKALTFAANMSAQVYGKTQSLDAAKLVSEAIGDTTVLTTSVQHGGSSGTTTGGMPGQDTTQRGESWSVTRAEAGRRLVKPEELLALPPEIMVVLTDRTPPVLVEQVRYYSPEFWGSASPGRVGSRLRRAATVVAIGLLGLCVLIGILDRPKPYLPFPAPPVEVDRRTTPDGTRGRPVGSVPNRPKGKVTDGREEDRP